MNQAKNKNDSILFIANLKPEVTKEMLEQAFEEFGEIDNTAIQQRVIKSGYVISRGFVAFEIPQDAKRAQVDGTKSADIRKLFLENKEPLHQLLAK